MVVNEERGYTIAEASEVLGISKDAIRRRIKSGKVSAFRVPTPQGYEWRVAIDAQPPSAVRLAHSDEQLAVSATRTAPGDPHMAAVVDRLTRENTELAGRVGFLQGRIVELEGQMRALQAPKRPEPEPIRPAWWRRLLGLEPA